jgi:hypothetical protein
LAEEKRERAKSGEKRDGVIEPNIAQKDLFSQVSGQLFASSFLESQLFDSPFFESPFFESQHLSKSHRKSV